MYKEMIDKLQTKIVELNEELEKKLPLETIDALLFKNMKNWFVIIKYSIVNLK